jgi:hypothetical protein
VVDPIIGGIISGLATNALTAMVRPTSRWAMGRSGSSPSDPPLTLTINTQDLAISLLAAFHGKSFSEQDITRLCEFLRTSEAQSIVQHIIVAKLTGEPYDHRTAISSELTAVLVLCSGIDSAVAAQMVEVLYPILNDACGRSIVRGREHDLISHELSLTAWNARLADYLNGISSANSFWRSRTTDDLHKIYRFEELYRQQAFIRHQEITPPHFEQRVRVPINNIYVPPNFSEVQVTAYDPTAMLQLNQAASRISYDDFVGKLNRTVVLGDPGAGKSTLAQKLIHDLCRAELDRTSLTLLPLLVVLRDYGIRRQEGMSIVDYIERKINTDYQLRPPTGAIEYLLITGRALVIFDGLDELLDTRLRQDIADDVETFEHLYPQAPILVTSRKVGYEQAPLRPSTFTTYVLNAFTEYDVKQYANKWYSLDRDIAKEERPSLVDSFMQESSVIADIRSNPLMLALLCNIYREEHYLPRNRPEVYEKCAVMLFERWDAGRNIKMQLPFRTHIDPAIKFLAHWIYSTAQFEGGVTERELVQKTAGYLMNRLYEDPDEAERAAQSFIQFCRGRAWVFTEVGSTGSEALYQFTHRSFLEYFTAAYLVRVNTHPEDLWHTLEPRISRREWDLVAQLAIQIQNRNLEGASDVLIRNLVEAATESRDERRKENLLSFGARILAIVVPSPKSTRLIARKCTEHCLARIQRTRGIRDQALNVELLGNLAYCLDDNSPAAVNSIVETCLVLSEEQDSSQTNGALRIGTSLATIFDAAHVNDIGHFKARRNWVAASEEFATRTLGTARTLMGTDRKIDISYWRFGHITMDELINLHGLSSLYVGGYSFSAEGSSLRTPPPAESVLGALAAKRPNWDSHDMQIAVHASEAIARFVKESKPPYLGEDDIAGALDDASPWSRLRNINRVCVESYPSLLFAGAIIVAVILEWQLHLEERRRTDVGIVESLGPVFRSRIGISRGEFGEEALKAAGLEALKASGLGDEDQSILRAWMVGRLSFVSFPPKVPEDRS